MVYCAVQCGSELKSDHSYESDCGVLSGYAQRDFNFLILLLIVNYKALLPCNAVYYAAAGDSKHWFLGWNQSWLKCHKSNERYWALRYRGAVYDESMDESLKLWPLRWSPLRGVFRGLFARLRNVVLTVDSVYEILKCNVKIKREATFMNSTIQWRCSLYCIRWF